MYSIMVREKTQSRLVKHPDSLWETSVVCSGSMANVFPDNTAEKYLQAGSSLSHQVFSPSLSVQLHSLSFIVFLARCYCF